MNPKARSVTAEGQPDGWIAPTSYRAQVAPDGTTRLVVAVPAEAVAGVHTGLIAVLGARVDVRYVQLTDRAVGQLPKPVSWVAMDLPTEDVLVALHAAAALIWEDGRHQLWIRGRREDSVVLDELGMLYTYPDDPAFRDLLAVSGIPLSPQLGLDGRDYVRVELLKDADALESTFIETLRMRRVG